MARQRKLDSLSIWMNGEYVGDWRSSGGRNEFSYADSWLSSASVRPLSLSLPLRSPGQPYRSGVGEFFDNLLPDNRGIRERIQRRFKTASIGAFDLLQEIGRDCVGAIQLLPAGEKPIHLRRIDAQPLTTGDVKRVLSDTLTPGFGEQDDFDRNDFRFSLAGAQEKTALLKYKGIWHKPAGSTPSTHILKLPIGNSPQGIDLSTSVENEWLCSKLMEGFGVPVSNCSMEQFGNYKVLVVERFDRRLSNDGKWIMRLPQEDFCQATATSPVLKYESDGGPGIRQIMNLLLGSQNPAEDRADFLRTQLIFWLLAAVDGHAKNFSVFLLAGGGYRLTPRYDILSAYPVMGHGRSLFSPQKIKMAMAVTGKNRHYRWKEISARHWLETARLCGLHGMQTIIEELINRTPIVVEKVSNQLPRHFPVQIAETILQGTAKAAREMGEQFKKIR